MKGDEKGDRGERRGEERRGEEKRREEKRSPQFWLTTKESTQYVAISISTYNVRPSAGTSIPDPYQF